MADTIPAIAFNNQLAYDVIVYDSFNNDDDGSGSATGTGGQPSGQTYFDTLTQLGKVPAGATVSLQPIHDSSVFIVESVSDNKPIKRLTALSFNDVTALSILQADEAAMTQTFQFVNFFINNPNDPTSVAFNKVINGTSDDLAGDIDTFFAAQPAYNKCCFEDYMMALAYTALHPPTPDPAQPPGTSSLKTVSTLMGSKWPSSLSDIFVAKFSCTSKDKNLILTFEVDISTLPFASVQIASNVLTVLSGTKVVKAQILFNYAIGLNIFGTRLSILMDALTIPLGDNKTLSIKKPEISIDINPLFKFVVFTMKATFPFNINGKSFDAIASFVIDNEEAAIGVDIQGDKSSLPAPPGLKGLHFDEFGVGMGLFFEPPGFALGVQGKFHIGDPLELALADAALAQAQQNLNQAGPLQMSDPAAYQQADMAYQAAADRDAQVRAVYYTPNITDDTFALVCEFVEEAILPKYIAFYVPKLSLVEVIALFTNVEPVLALPINFTDLSFHWSDGLMDAVVLPDGTLSNGGYGFSAWVDMLSFNFYGEVNVDINSGITANMELSPISWGNLFKLTGDGKGYSLKMDANGNPIKNNFVPATQAEKNAVQNATSKQIVAAGGPALIINTLTQPILHLNAKVSLFEVIDYGIEADINSDGIKFELDYGGVLTEKMSCTLADFHNFYGDFKFGINRSITLPTIAGVSLGSIHVEALADAHLSITSSLYAIVFKIGGSFDFEGKTRQFGDFNASVRIQKITDVIEAVITNLADDASQVFDDVVQNADVWLDKAKRGLITGYNTVSEVLKSGFNKSADEVASLMKGAGYAADEVASEIKSTFNLSVDAVESAMKAAGYAANEVIDALKNVFSINDIASALKNVYGLSVNDINSFLQSAGYTADQVKTAFESLGGDFASFAKDAWDKITNPDTWNPSKW